MREKSRLILAAALASAAAFPSALLADVGTLVAETPSPCVYAADTRPSPRAITAAEEFAAITGGTKKSSWRQGETVTLTAPDGTETTLGTTGEDIWYVCNTAATENDGKGLVYTGELKLFGDVRLILEPALYLEGGHTGLNHFDKESTSVEVL